MHTPSARSVLVVLPKARLTALGRDLDIAVPSHGTKETQVQALLGSGRVQMRDLLGRLKRDELKAACRAHGLDDSGRARQQLSGRLLEAREGPESAPPASLFSAAEVARHVPRALFFRCAAARRTLVVGSSPACGQARLEPLTWTPDEGKRRRPQLSSLIELIDRHAPRVQAGAM